MTHDSNAAERPATRMGRRAFFRALAASVVAVGAPLPLGFPTEPVAPKQMDFLWRYYLTDRESILGGHGAPPSEAALAS